MIRLHPLFLALLVISLLFGYLLEFILMFAIVILHEIGHWLMARRVGWTVQELRLLPYGGELVVAEDRLSRPRDEVLVAIAGPAVNLLLMLICSLLSIAGIVNREQEIFFQMANMNILLFNLLPVLPLDGGKIVQALLCSWISYYRSMRIAVHVSLIASLILLFASCLTLNLSGIHFNLLLLAFFLLASNLQRLKQMPLLFIRFLLQKWTHTADAGNPSVYMRRIFVNCQMPIRDMLRKLHKRCHHRFFMVDERFRLQQVVEESALLNQFFESHHGMDERRK